MSSKTPKSNYGEFYKGNNHRITRETMPEISLQSNQL
jgi:hypothetical protein